MDFLNISVIIFLHLVETLKWKHVFSGRDEKRKITCRCYHAKEFYFEPFSKRHQVHRFNTSIVISLNIVAVSQRKYPLSCDSCFRILDHILNHWKQPSKWLTLLYIIIFRTVFCEKKAYYIILLHNISDDQIS